jgi:hypothetical protein
MRNLKMAMADFEAFVLNAVKAGLDRVVPGCVCVALDKDGVCFFAVYFVAVS